MTGKFHINRNTNEPGPCEAKERNCPVANDGDHYTSLEAATAESEKRSEGEYGWGSLSKNNEKLSAEVLGILDEITELERNPALNHYGLPEDEVIRSNITKKIRTLRRKVDSLHPWANFSHISQTPSPGDVELARNEVAQEIITRGDHYTWSEVMGRKHKSPANIISYREIVAKQATRIDPWNKKVEAKARENAMRNRFALAYESGFAIPPQYNTAFEEIWVGDVNQIGSEAYLKDQIDKFDRGPKNNFTGMPPELRKLYRALETRGRSFGPSIETVSNKAKANGWAFSDVN